MSKNSQTADPQSTKKRDREEPHQQLDGVDAKRNKQVRCITMTYGLF